MTRSPSREAPWQPTVQLTLTSTRTDGTTYQFRATDGLGWALCTVNDQTGELLITSDWGNWSHRWDPRPSCLGAPSLTAFIGGRGDVDYLARKLQREGHAGRRWSARLTALNLCQRLRERRLEDGREQIDRRLDPGERGRYGAYDDQGLPIYSYRSPAGSGSGPLPYLTRDGARRLWDAICDLARDCDHAPSPDLFYERVCQVDGFTDYVTTEPWEFGETRETATRALVAIWDGELTNVTNATAALCALLLKHAGEEKGTAVKDPENEDPQRCPHGHMPREAGSGHWRDWHSGHGCHLDPRRASQDQKTQPSSEGIPSTMSDADTRPRSTLTFLEALKTRRPMRRSSTLASRPWLYLGRNSLSALTTPTWRRIDTGEPTALDREDYMADDWEVMP